MLTPEALTVLRWIAAGDKSAPPPFAGDELARLMGELLVAGAVGERGEVTPLGHGLLA